MEGILDVTEGAAVGAAKHRLNPNSKGSQVMNPAVVQDFGA